jgi:hypothetical protein
MPRKMKSSRLKLLASIPKLIKEQKAMEVLKNEAK